MLSSDNNTIKDNYIHGDTWGDTGPGVDISDSFNNKIINNTILVDGRNTCGFRLTNSGNNTLTNNKITTPVVDSLCISGGATKTYYNHPIDTTNLADGKPIRYYFDIHNQAIEDITDVGQILVTFSTDIALNNITITNADGIHLFNVNSSLVKNSNISGATGRGVYLYNSYKNSLTDNNLYTTTESGHSILLERSDNNTITGNTLRATGAYANVLYFYDSVEYNTISNNIIDRSVCTSGSSGNYLRYASLNTFIDNTIKSCPTGFYLQDTSYNNTFISNNITILGACSPYGFEFVSPGSKDNEIIGSTITSNYRGIEFSSSGNMVRNTVINASDMDILSGNNVENTLLNVTFNKSDVNLGSGSNLTVTWYLDIYVKDSSGNPVDQVNVMAWMNNGTEVFSELTASDGYITTQALTEYTQNSSQVYPNDVTLYTNYTINATKSGYGARDGKEVNLTESMLVVMTLDIPQTPQRRRYLYITTSGNCVDQDVIITAEDDNNNPLSGVDVDTYFNESSIESLTTGSNGETSFIPSVVGIYLIKAWKSGYRDDEKSITVIECESCSDGIRNQNETDMDCGGICPPCEDGKNCSTDLDCISEWCYNGTCRTSTCNDDIKGPDEEDIDCGGSCPACRTIQVVKNETEEGGAGAITYNASSTCLNNRKDTGETDIDCGGHCSPCKVGKECRVNSDCLSEFCHEGICRITTCDDRLLGPKEEKVDCGGPCGDCPQIKVNEFIYVNETLTIKIINPREGLILVVKDPSLNVTEYNISEVGGKTYYFIYYRPERTGTYLIDLIGYNKLYSRVIERPSSILDYILREAISLLVPLLLICIFAIWFTRRRTKVVVDGSAIRRFIAEDMSQKLIKKYKMVYTAAEIEEKIKELVFIELSESELDQAEDLSDRYGILLDEAKSLVLCKKLRARKFITGVELPEEIEDKFEGTKIITVEDEFGIMGL